MSRSPSLLVAFSLATLPITTVAQTAASGTSTVDPTSARVSDVYVGTSKGVYVYHANVNGSVSLVPGSPFPIGGAAIGSNRSLFFSQGLDNLHVYPVASNGAIKAQISQVDTRTSSGSECGKASGAVLDHTGHIVYVQLEDSTQGGSEGPCVALQSYKVSGTGAISFLGSTQYATQQAIGTGGFATPLKLSGTGNFGYSSAADHECKMDTFVLKRESSGAMMLNSNQYLTIPGSPQYWRWFAWYMTSDPTNHMASMIQAETDDFGPCGSAIPVQLVSFTIAPDGSLSTTNTADNMPVPKVDPEVLNMSTSGQFLAIGGYDTNVTAQGSQPPGLQVFRFNGANPITPISDILTTAPIDEIHWDNTDHLYALSNSTHKLYVYSVTSSSISAAPGSPFTIPSTPNSLAVVPLQCSVPASDGVHICSPASGSSAASPVLVSASSKITGTLDRMELWVDGVKKYTGRSTQMSAAIKLSSGQHRFGIFAVNTAGQKWNSVVSASVY